MSTITTEPIQDIVERVNRIHELGINIVDTEDAFRLAVEVAELHRALGEEMALAEQTKQQLKRLRASREDKRGRYLDSEGIGAGAEGDQLITWGGDIDQIEVRPSPHGGKVFVALGMVQLDAYKSVETCPQVRVTLTDEHARELADGIYASLDSAAGGA